MAVDIGKAFVQIVPSAEGIEGSITKLLGGESKKAGKESGRNLGNNLVSTIKSIIAGAGIGAVLKETIEAGAKLQQSFGGLDTLYGNAAVQAKEYAKQAAAAGISMNTYSEQAVSFGAALKKALGGDVVKAADAANLAILDMADNSAKMGTDIGSIQSAYQGFAKQNYTMLDNLKLGYGGTKTEMERLLKDAKKLTGVKYDINNLADVYSAIHVIQEDLGLTGVAASEAATTISGSFVAVKASAENLMASLTLGEDIQPALESLVQSASAFLFDNLVPALGNIVRQSFSTIKGIVSENLPAMIENGMNALASLAQGIEQNLPLLVGMMGTVIGNVARAIVDNLPLIIEKGIEIISSLLTGAIKAVPMFFQGIKNAFAGIDWKSIGDNLVEGIKNGITNGVSKVVEAAKNLANKAWSTVKNILGIHSPSTKFAWIGEMSDKGMAKGLNDNVGVIEDAMSNITAAMIDPFDSSTALTYGVSGGVSAVGHSGYGFNQVINNYSPKALNPSEVARQTRNGTKQLALQLSIGG